jgi:hypothetical protein
LIYRRAENKGGGPQGEASHHIHNNDGREGLIKTATPPVNCLVRCLEVISNAKAGPSKFKPRHCQILNPGVGLTVGPQSRDRA